MPMVKNIEWTRCLEYPQQIISSSIAALSFIGFIKQWKWLKEKLADGEEYRMNKLSRVSTAKNI